MDWKHIDAGELLQELPLAAAVVDAAGLVFFANPALRSLLRLPAGPWSPRYLSALRESEEPGDLAIRRAVARHGSWEGDTRYRTATGETLWVRETVRALHGAGNSWYVHFLADLTLSRRVDELSALAFHDGLTGLPNRNLLADRAHQAIERARRGTGGFALFYVDIDGLKAINDGAGHGAGDRCLQAVARTLRESLRKRDTVARIGGDEFVALVEEVGGEPALAKIAAKLLRALRRIAAPGPWGRLTASIGVSIFPRHGEHLDELLERADAALYRAKREGRDGWTLAEERRAPYAAVPAEGSVRQ